MHITAVGLRTCETGTTLALLSFSKRSERRAGCRRPSTRRVRRVNPLLGGVLVWGVKQEVRRCSLASIRFLCSLFLRGPHFGLRPCHGRQGRTKLSDISLIIISTALVTLCHPRIYHHRISAVCLRSDQSFLPIPDDSHLVDKRRHYRPNIHHE